LGVRVRRIDAEFAMSILVPGSELVDRIDALLPQTQCTKCGYQGCRPYAEAIEGGVAINQCPPGGAAGITKLATLLNRPRLPLNPANGREQPLTVAIIDEDLCIGCTLCIDACPVDAIVGAPKRMHTVIASWCTGCDLCLPPCPMDCIVMRPVDPAREWTETDARTARARHLARKRRLQSAQEKERPRVGGRAAPSATRSASPSTDAGRKQAIIAAAVERARRRRGQLTRR
jgi:electron transport complex protein RnfB